MELLAERVGPDLGKEAETLCDFIVRGVGRMRAMITGLLEYSRASTAPLEHERVESRRLVEDVMETLASTIDGVHIESGELPVVAADAMQLQRVFQNLIGNAIQNRRTDPPVVRVSASRDGNFQRFAVADNGRGIEPGIARTIFEPFQRGRGNGYEVAGLGLALCRRIVERHGGSIWVESQPGAGSTFYFTIPDRSQ